MSSDPMLRERVMEILQNVVNERKYGGYVGGMYDGGIYEGIEGGWKPKKKHSVWQEFLHDKKAQDCYKSYKTDSKVERLQKSFEKINEQIEKKEKQIEEKQEKLELELNTLKSAKEYYKNRKEKEPSLSWNQAQKDFAKIIKKRGQEAELAAVLPQGKGYGGYGYGGDGYGGDMYDGMYGMGSLVGGMPVG